MHSETKYQDSAQKYSRPLGLLSPNHFENTGEKKSKMMVYNIENIKGDFIGYKIHKSMLWYTSPHNLECIKRA